MILNFVDVNLLDVYNIYCIPGVEIWKNMDGAENTAAPILQEMGCVNRLLFWGFLLVLLNLSISFVWKNEIRTQTVGRVSGWIVIIH